MRVDRYAFVSVPQSKYLVIAFDKDVEDVNGHLRPVLYLAHIIMFSDQFRLFYGFTPLQFLKLIVLPLDNHHWLPLLFLEDLRK